MTEPHTIIRRFLFELVAVISLGQKLLKSSRFVISVLPIFFYLNILKIEKMLQFRDKKILDVRGIGYKQK